MYNAQTAPRYQRDDEDLALTSGCPYTASQSFYFNYLLRDINHGLDIAQDQPAGLPRLACAVRL